LSEPGQLPTPVASQLTFLSYGTTARAARYFGADDRAAAVQEGVQATWLALGLGALIVVVVESAAAPLVSVIAGSPDIAGPALSWLRIPSSVRPQFWFGAAAVAAHQVVLQLWSFPALVLDSLAIAAQALVGAALGAGDVPPATATARRVTVASAIAATGLAAVFASGASVLPALFTDDSVLAAIGTPWWFLVAQLPFAGVVFALDGVHSAPGTRRSCGPPPSSARWRAFCRWLSLVCDWGVAGHLLGAERVHRAATDLRRMASSIGSLGDNWLLALQCNSAPSGHNRKSTFKIAGKADCVMRNAGLDFEVLGPLQMLADGRPVPLGAPKQRAVLAMLVLNRNRPVSVDALIDAVWEQEPVPAARTSIHSYVSRLRGLIGSAGVDANQVLVSAAPGYQLSVDDFHCDLGRFIAEKNAGVHAAAAGRFEEASRHLSVALAEWRGAVLDDLHEFAFVGTFATALSEVRVVAHTAFAEAEIACGRADALIPRLEMLCAQHPYRERLWAQLITAYYVAERQSDALDAFRRLKTNLAENLGIDPGPTVSALHERILRQQPLDAVRTTQTTAKHSVVELSPATGTLVNRTPIAELRGRDGQRFRLDASTRIGRLPDNDIVIDDENVSRYHAVVIDTGGGFVISDLRSTNGVLLHGRRIRGSAALADGDDIGIGGHEFTFKVVTPEPISAR